MLKDIFTIKRTDLIILANMFPKNHLPLNQVVTHIYIIYDSTFDQSPSLWQVYVGKHHYTVADETEQQIGLERIVIHSQFNNASLDNDLALLVLAVSNVFTFTVIFLSYENIANCFRFDKNLSQRLHNVFEIDKQNRSLVADQKYSQCVNREYCLTAEKCFNCQAFLSESTYFY